MGFLAKFPTVSNSVAGLIVFLSSYITAVITAFIFFDSPQFALWLLASVAFTSLLFMTVVFIVAWSLRRTDIVDIAWGLVFIVIAVNSWLLSDYAVVIGWNAQTITMVLVGIWGLRLATVLLLRTAGRPEDKRYVELRKKWRGNAALNTYFRIFVTQGLLAIIVSTAVIIVLTSPLQTPGVYTYVGVGIWLIGFIFETVGDWQLKQFIKSPSSKGKLLTSGLWRYTRHPNYFGEAAMWWGIFVISLSAYIGWMGVISPVIITFLLLFVSGVPMAEAAMQNKPGWKKYAARTSKFLPLPPKEV
jgi:steroid 5-alpha reductase family enzyme